MDEELVKNSCDKNTINNYNEFIGKKDSNSLKNNNNKIMDYYHKKKDLNAIAKENKVKKNMSKSKKVKFIHKDWN